ncbi:hypothetical protein AB0M48_32935 [Lentzea sp. NPDC051208]
MVAALIASDVCQPIGRITGNPFLSVKGSVRGFVFAVATGVLTEVKP